MNLNGIFSDRLYASGEPSLLAIGAAWGHRST